jgi:IS1 family transposase
MSQLSRDQQIQVIGCLTEGMSIRVIERLTGIHRDTIMRLGARVGRGCAELHDRMFVGLRVGRLELDELWSYVGKKQRNAKRHETEKGDQWTYVALASSSRAIVSYRTGKRDSANTQEFMADLRERVLGTPEISSDGFKPYLPAVRSEFSGSAHGIVEKTFSVTHLNMRQSQHRYSPASVVAVDRQVAYGMPEQISTSYVERSHLTLRQSCKRFVRLGTGFSKKLENHASAVSLYVAHYNLCRVHESLRQTPAMALGIADKAWSLGQLIDAALAVATPDPTETAPERRRKFKVIQGGVS